MASSRKSAQRGTDRLKIASGALGPVPKCELDIKPLTVFVGRQGTGKSLVAQVIFSFEELPFLMALASVERGMSKRTSQDWFRWVLDRLRSSDRAFATFANKNVHIQWARSAPFEGIDFAPSTLEFRAYQNNRQIVVPTAMATFLDKLRRALARDESALLHHAVFFPTERMVISQLRSAMSERLLGLPITYTLFSHWLDIHAAPEAAKWPGGRPVDEDAQTIDTLTRDALGGSARKLGEQWKWELGKPGARVKFDLDLASSGQRANWSLGYLGRTLFSLRGSGDVAEQLTLFIEEPEIHLHPSAQREMVKVIALMVNRGFRVVLTTHSMSVLYTLNNLLQASLVGGEPATGVPAPQFRLRASDVSVYSFEEGKPPKQLVDPSTAFIDERALGSVADELSMELNQIGARLAERSE